MQLEVVTPEENMGDVIGDLNKQMCIRDRSHIGDPPLSIPEAPSTLGVPSHLIEMLKRSVGFMCVVSLMTLS